ncbi:MAG: DUF2617 family protein [Planctomycetota bacterium]
MLSARPKVAELVFQLFGRPLHPELFEVYQARRIQRGGYTADVQITSAGHVVTWRYEGLTLTEVAAASTHPLPTKRRLMSHALKREGADDLACRGGVSYAVSFSVEQADEEKFQAYQKELTLQATRQGLMHRFDSSGRLGTGAVSYINLESRDKLLRLRALHTFPDDRALLKIQSSYRLPG